MRHSLRDIAEIGAGQGAPQGDSNYCDDGTTFVKAGNLESLAAGGSLSEIQKVSDEVAKTHRLKLYPKGTVLFAKSGMSCLKGYVYILPQEAYVVSHLACITPKEEVSEYLRYYFTYHKPNQLVKDAAYPSISLFDIGSLEIDTKDEQTRADIVSVLQSVERVIGLRKQELSSLDDLLKARFVEMFVNRGYPSEKLGKICSKITDGTHKTPTYLQDGVTFISAKNIINGELDFSDVKYIAEAEYQEIQKRCQTERLDILLSKSGSLGSPAIVRTEEKLGLFESLAVLKYDREKILPEFLCEQLKTDGIQRQFTVGTKGVAIKHLHLGVIADTDIIVPPIEEQKAFADFVQQIDKSKFII